MRKEKPPLPPRERALGLLSRREHSARELKRKLQQKGVAAEEAGDVVGEMGDRNYQSDARFAESLVRRRALDGYGPLRIRAELASHGIVREAATAAIATARSFHLQIPNLRSSTPKLFLGSRSGIFSNATPVTHIRIYSTVGDITGGSLTVLGR